MGLWQELAVEQQQQLLRILGRMVAQNLVVTPLPNEEVEHEQH